MSSSLDLQDPKIAEFFLAATKGNREAAHLLMLVAKLAREVDDMVDEDITEHNDRQRRMSTIVELSLVQIATNKFYLENLATLSCCILSMLVFWRTADEFREKTYTEENVDKGLKYMHFGYVWRESSVQFFVTVASILGGHEHAMKALAALFELTHAKSEDTPETWTSEHLPVSESEPDPEEGS